VIDLILAAAGSTVQAAEHGSFVFDWHGVFNVLITAISVASISGGIFFVFAGTLGVLRLPDFFTRIHAAGMTDTLGVELILLGLIIQAGFSLLSLKFLLVAFFLLLTSPTATHAIANAAYHAGLKPYLGRYQSPNIAELRGPQEPKK
jgi:multicomponent Na+:H+ antiporter subunit G